MAPVIKFDLNQFYCPASGETLDDKDIFIEEKDRNVKL